MQDCHLDKTKPRIVMNLLTQTNQQNVSSEISPLVAGNLLDTVNMSDVIPPPAQKLDFDDDTLRGRKRYNLKCQKQFRK